MDMTHALDLDASAVGFHPFSRDDTLNYQANRWLHDDPQALEDFRTAAPSSTSSICARRSSVGRAPGAV